MNANIHPIETHAQLTQMKSRFKKNATRLLSLTTTQAGLNNGDLN